MCFFKKNVTINILLLKALYLATFEAKKTDTLYEGAIDMPDFEFCSTN